MKEYKCAECSLVGYRLFCDAGSSHVRLLCVACAELDQDEAYDTDSPSSIGGLVSAVTTEDGAGLYGPTSAPTERVFWYYSLPLRPGQTDAERVSEYRQLYEGAARDTVLFEHRGAETRRLISGLALIDEVLDMALTSRSARHEQLVWLTIAVQTLQQGGTPTDPRPGGRHQ